MFWSQRFSSKLYPVEVSCWTVYIKLWELHRNDNTYVAEDFVKLRKHQDNYYVCKSVFLQASSDQHEHT